MSRTEGLRPGNEVFDLMRQRGIPDIKYKAKCIPGPGQCEIPGQVSLQKILIAFKTFVSSN